MDDLDGCSFFWGGTRWRKVKKCKKLLLIVSHFGSFEWLLKGSKR